MEQPTEIPAEKKPTGILPTSLVLVVVLLCGLYYYFVTHYVPKDEQGTFGDMFGGLNALFSGLAFAGLIYTVYLQTQELSLQRKELSMTREELQRTAKANEESAKALTKQLETQLIAARISGLTALLSSKNAEMANQSPAGQRIIKPSCKELEEQLFTLLEKCQIGESKE